MSKQPSERITKAKQFRMLAKGYKALKKDKATTYQAAAEALERTNKPEVPTKVRLREPELIR
jgi:hypothetical protein